MYKNPSNTHMNRYKKLLSIKEIAELKDKDIDYTDIPELDADFWDEAEIHNEQDRSSVSTK